MALSLTMFSATEMPTPVSPDSVSPLASVKAEPSCDALAVTAPLNPVLPARVPSRALVSLLATVSAKTGVMAVLPAAPPCATVSMSFFDAADIVRLRVPVSATLLPSTASVSVSPMFRASEMPMPNLPKPDWLATARASFSTKFCAVSDTSFASVMVTVVVAAVSEISAVASVKPMLMASEPAMPVLTPLTPDAALAPMRAVVSLHSSRCEVPVPSEVRLRRPALSPNSASTWLSYRLTCSPSTLT